MSQLSALPQSVKGSPKSALDLDLHPASLHSSQKPLLHNYYDALYAASGPQHWWPGRSRFEVIVGAILTQNTSWKNVERAIANLRKAELLSPAAIRRVSSAKLAACLRPSGYFRQKTKTLKTFVAFLYRHYRGSLDRLFARPTDALRPQLLHLRGIGPETADCILLYAGKHAVFVVDAYTRRIIERHLLLPVARQATSKSYEQLRAFFESQLPRNHQLFNEFHALIVKTGKDHCFKSNPSCELCPLGLYLPASGNSRSPSRSLSVTHS